MNLDLYDKVREVPQEAQKQIGGGRLKGMTDINPMWRIKVLTQQFGVCGFGWKYTITDQWTEVSTDGKNVKAFCNVELFVKMGDVWSEAIPGTGGSSFCEQEKNGLFTSDECYKMALTDALSVCCKSLGVGADIYFAKDRTKYDQEQNHDQELKQIYQNAMKKGNLIIDSIKTLDDVANAQKALQGIHHTVDSQKELLDKLKAVNKKLKEGVADGN